MNYGQLSKHSSFYQTKCFLLSVKSFERSISSSSLFDIFSNRGQKYGTYEQLKIDSTWNANRQGIPSHSTIIRLQMIISRPKSQPCYSCIEQCPTPNFTWQTKQNQLITSLEDMNRVIDSAQLLNLILKNPPWTQRTKPRTPTTKNGKLVITFNVLGTPVKNPVWQS